MFRKTAVTANAFIGKCVTFICGVERGLTVTHTQQITEATQGSEGHHQPKQGFLVHDGPPQAVTLFEVDD